MFDEPKGNAKPRATGIVFMDNIAGMFRSVCAKKEVILTLGALQSPQLLMISVRLTTGRSLSPSKADIHTM